MQREGHMNGIGNEAMEMPLFCGLSKENRGVTDELQVVTKEITT